MSAGGVPSALAIILTLGCLSATSTWGVAVASVQPSSCRLSLSLSSIGTPWSARIFFPKSRCSWGTILRSVSANSSADRWESMPSYLFGITMSTPYGWSPMFSSIHFSSISSCSGVKPTAPSTPNPPALLTATTTSRQWVNAKIGNSIPSSSQIAVCMPTPWAVAELKRVLV